MSNSLLLVLLNIGILLFVCLGLLLRLARDDMAFVDQPLLLPGGWLHPGRPDPGPASPRADRLAPASGDIIPSACRHAPTSMDPRPTRNVRYLARASMGRKQSHAS